MTEILVVANETLGGRRLREVLAQKAKIEQSLAIRLVIPQSRPRRGSVIYVQSVRDAAQVRLELALRELRRQAQLSRLNHADAPAGLIRAMRDFELELAAARAALSREFPDER